MGMVDKRMDGWMNRLAEWLPRQDGWVGRTGWGRISIPNCKQGVSGELHTHIP